MHTLSIILTVIAKVIKVVSYAGICCPLSKRPLNHCGTIPRLPRYGGILLLVAGVLVPVLVAARPHLWLRGLYHKWIFSFSLAGSKHNIAARGLSDSVILADIVCAWADLRIVRVDLPGHHKSFHLRVQKTLYNH